MNLEVWLPAMFVLGIVTDAAVVCCLSKPAKKSEASFHVDHHYSPRGRVFVCVPVGGDDSPRMVLTSTRK